MGPLPRLDMIPAAIKRLLGVLGDVLVAFLDLPGLPEIPERTLINLKKEPQESIEEIGALQRDRAVAGPYGR